MSDLFWPAIRDKSHSLFTSSEEKLSADLKAGLKNGTTVFPQAETVRQLLSEIDSEIQDRDRRRRAAIAGDILPESIVSDDTRTALEQLSRDADPETSTLAKELLNRIQGQ